jgi:hypothetical protein
MTDDKTQTDELRPMYAPQPAVTPPPPEPIRFRAEVALDGEVFRVSVILREAYEVSEVMNALRDLARSTAYKVFEEREPGGDADATP